MRRIRPISHPYPFSEHFSPDRNVTLVEVNALLRSQFSQSAEANQALQDDLRKLTADWSRAVEEAERKELDWSKEKEVSGGERRL